jgi:hypothetical protein
LFMSTTGFRALAFGLTVLAAAAAASAQDLVKEGLASFPPDTIRLEYSNVGKLRALPDYATLHKRYLAPTLRALETQLASLGVQESDINEVVLAWQLAGSGMSLEGLASGRLDPQAMARQAATQNITTLPVGSVTAYCFGSTDSAPCVAPLGGSLGAFGTVDQLRGLVGARGGQTAGLRSNAAFTSLVEREGGDAPIWGVAVGPAIEDWFKVSMPVQKNLPVDLASVFQNVQSLGYVVEPTDKVHVNMDLNCTTAAAAGTLRQQFDALRLFQKVAWQRQYPNVANPFEGLTVTANDTTMTLSMSTPYSAIEAAVRQ